MLIYINNLYEYNEKDYIEEKMHFFNILKAENNDVTNHYQIIEYLANLMNNMKYIIFDGLVARSSDVFAKNKDIQIEIIKEVKKLIEKSKPIVNYKDEDLEKIYINKIVGNKNE